MIYRTVLICDLNYKGSAGNIEPVGTQQMWN